MLLWMPWTVYVWKEQNRFEVTLAQKMLGEPKEEETGEMKTMTKEVGTEGMTSMTKETVLAIRYY